MNESKNAAEELFSREPVLIIDDWWDGPKTGVALYGGRPHYFERIFDEALDDYSDRYRLMPLNATDLRTFEEQAEIFQRWSNAFDNGETDRSTHPALPGERERSKALDVDRQKILESARAAQFEVIGKHSNITPSAGRVEYPETNSQFTWSLL
jgi:hypothetical protein